MTEFWFGFGFGACIAVLSVWFVSFVGWLVGAHLANKGGAKRKGGV